MQVLRVFNNNVVLARRGGQEVVATGRGIGFNVKPGSRIDPADVERVYVPAATVSAVAHCLAAEHVQATPSLVTAIADHVSFAVERALAAHSVSYPLHDEIVSLYPNEHAVALRVIERLNHHLAAPLPEAEATAIALHLVNADFAPGDLSRTYAMTDLIQQVLDVVGQDMGVGFKGASLSKARFITHLRYLLARLERGERVSAGTSVLNDQLLTAYPREIACARKVASVIELRCNQPLNEDEIAYLGLHIARLRATERNHHD